MRTNFSTVVEDGGPVAGRRSDADDRSLVAGPLADLHRFFSEAASPAPDLKHARPRAAALPTPIVDRCCSACAEHIRVLRDGLQTETGLTADGQHA